MRGRLFFLGGLAAGFVLGARAGRECYGKMLETAQRVADSPTLQEAVGVVQERATRLCEAGRTRMSCCGFNETAVGRRLCPERPEEAGAHEADETVGDTDLDETPATPGPGSESAPDSASGPGA